MRTSGIRARLQDDLRDAMKARDKVRVGVLRATLGAIANGEAVPTDAPPNVPGRPEAGATEVPRRDLDEGAVRAIIAGEIAELGRDADVFRDRGDAAPLADLEARIEILRAYLA
jgi:hypothetical protein